MARVPTPLPKVTRRLDMSWCRKVVCRLAGVVAGSSGIEGSVSLSRNDLLLSAMVARL
jgi:hypothetical protein